MFTGISLGVVVAIIAVIALLGIIASGYVKAPPDTAYIISGLRKKIIIGKSSIKIPFLERLDKLSLKLIPIDVKQRCRRRITSTFRWTQQLTSRFPASPKN